MKSDLLNAARAVTLAPPPSEEETRKVAGELSGQTGTEAYPRSLVKTETTLGEHVYIVHEMKRLGIGWVRRRVTSGGSKRGLITSGICAISSRA